MANELPKSAPHTGARLAAAQVAAFCDALAQSCNVQQSAKTAGIARGRVYRERRLNPEFRAQWDLALSEGYAHLEAAALADALSGARASKTALGQKERERVLKLRMWLLDRHRTSATLQQSESHAELLDSAHELLIAKLDAMAARTGRGAP